MLRHNRSVNAARLAGCALLSCSPPASARPRSPASWGSPRQSVSDWHARWQAGGPDALRSQGPTGPTPRLSDRQLGQVEQVLVKGAGANGFVGELWTLDRIALVIERLTGVRHHPAHVWALLHHRLGWSVQRPVRRAAERDQVAVDRWVKERWPAIKQTVSVWACGPGGSLSGSGAGIAA